MNPLSRREFVSASALISQAAGVGQQVGGTALTAGEVVNRIKQNVGMPWRSVTVDQIIAGDESTPVGGIASVMMATQEVVECAAAEGKNMIVTHETPLELSGDSHRGSPMQQKLPRVTPDGRWILYMVGPRSLDAAFYRGPVRLMRVPAWVDRRSR